MIGRLVPRLMLGFLREMEVAMTAGFSFFFPFFLIIGVSSPVVYVIDFVSSLSMRLLHFDFFPIIAWIGSLSCVIFWEI